MIYNAYIYNYNYKYYVYRLRGWEYIDMFFFTDGNPTGLRPRSRKSSGEAYLGFRRWRRGRLAVAVRHPSGRILGK